MLRNCAIILLVAILGLALPVDAGQDPKAKPVDTRLNLAIFLFEGVQIIDYTGPYEVFGQANANGKRLFNVYTVAEKAGPLKTNMGMTVTPTYSFADAPKADVVVLPGGGVPQHLDKPAVIDWVKKSAAEAQIVLSVCNGAFYLGKAGLLDGLSATTFYGLIDELQELAPKCKVVRDQRFVDNGKIITTAGLSSGIDGALHVIERIAGRPAAQGVALNMEYNWQPDVNYARASFADMHLMKMLGHEGFKFPDEAPWRVVSQAGDRNRWEKHWEVVLAWPAENVVKVVDETLARSWTRVDASASNGATTSRWQFADESGGKWQAKAAVKSTAAETYAIDIWLKRGR